MRSVDVVRQLLEAAQTGDDATQLPYIAALHIPGCLWRLPMTGFKRGLVTIVPLVRVYFVLVDGASEVSEFGYVFAGVPGSGSLGDKNVR